MLGSSVKHDLQTIQSLLLVRSKEQMDAIKSEFDKLNDAHTNYVLELGYYTKNHKRALSEKKQGETPIVKPSKVIERFIKDNPNGEEFPTLGNLLTVLGDQTQQLKSLISQEKNSS